MSLEQTSNRGAISRREWLAVVALLLLAFTLRTIDLARVPPGLHNDEVVAAQMAESVMNGRLAIFFPEDTGSEPLHYYFSAPIMRVFGSTVFALRLPSMALSLIGASAMWAVARRLFGPPVALTALAGFAIVFWTVEFGRIVSPVVMMVPLGTLSAYFFWRAYTASADHKTAQAGIPMPAPERHGDAALHKFVIYRAGGRRALPLWALSGLWLGMSILSYTAARILPVIFAAFGVYVLIAHRAEWRRWWMGIALTLIVATVVALPMFLYLMVNPAADQLDFFDIDRPLVELRQGHLAPVIQTTLNTLGMFAFAGDPLPYYDVPGRPVFEPIGALLLAAGLLIAFRRWRRPEYAFVVLWFFLSLAPGMLSQPAPNYTRTLGVQIVLFAIPGIAVAALLERWRSAIVYAGLGIVFLGNIAWTAHDYFVVWPGIDTVRFWHQSGLKAVADRLQAAPDSSPVALCLPEWLIDEREPWWKPGWQHLRYLLHRPDVSLRYYDCVDSMVFIEGPARYAVPDAADADALGAFPFYSQFLAAADRVLDILPDRSGIILGADATAALDQHLTEVAAGSVAAWAPEAGGEPAHLPVSFGDKVELLGYTLHPSSLIPHPSSSFDLTTYWRVTGSLPPQLSQFTHVLDADGTIVAQQDRLALTSASLRAGDIFAQIHRVTLPADLDEGDYSLSVGLYTLRDGSRLPIRQGGQPRGDRLWLRSITVEK